MMVIIVFIIILALLILVHEFGHFIAAKKNGVLVEEFGIGFPPRLFSLKKGETVYSVNLIPLGGFVKVYGEEYHEAVKNKKRAFIYKKPWQKASIIVSGIVGNFILSWILISFLLTQGLPLPTGKVLVQQVQSGSPAQSSGLIKGDAIKNLVVQNKTYPLSSSQELISLTKKIAGQTVTLIVERGKEERQITLLTRKNPPKGQGPLGVVITSYLEKKYSWYEAPFFGLLQTATITKQITTEIAKIAYQAVRFQKPKIEVAGPIGIAQFTGQALQVGGNAVLELMALLSINLAVINIVPFPALDGGRLVFVLYEWVSRKRVSRNVEKYSHMIGLMVLLSLALIISVNDIIRIIR